MSFQIYSGINFYEYSFILDPSLHWDYKPYRQKLTKKLSFWRWPESKTNKNAKTGTPIFSIHSF